MTIICRRTEMNDKIEKKRKEFYYAPQRYECKKVVVNEI